MNAQHHLQKTKEVYENVINKVCSKLLEDQENDSEMADEVIDRFKELWKKKIEDRQVYIYNERDHPHNNDLQKRETISNTQSRQNAGVLQMNQNKNELSDDKTQLLLNQVISMTQQTIQKQNQLHPYPNQHEISSDPIKKIKTEEILPYCKITKNNLGFDSILISKETTAFQKPNLKLEDNTQPLGLVEQDDLNLDFSGHPLFEPIKQVTLERTKSEIEESIQRKNVKIEKDDDAPINYLEGLDMEQDHNYNEEQEREHTEFETTQAPQEDKNEQFLNDKEFTSQSYMLGYYTEMKKKTAQKFKIGFKNIIASLEGKDYLINVMSGDLEW